jgi:cytochrome c2
MLARLLAAQTPRCVTMSAMPRADIHAQAATIVLTAWFAAGAACAQSASAPAATLAMKLRALRSSPTDLEVSGDVRGVPRNESRFLAREDLLAVARDMSISPDDGNFKTTTKVRAIPLEELSRALGVPAKDMVIADCRDKYQAHYPLTYLAVHHPVLVVEMNGASLPDSKADDYGPYMIAHEAFKPAFKILAHSDEPQIPWGVIGLQFCDEKTFLAPVAPQGPHAGDKSARAGAQIAEQNCLRCHYNGTTGGAKSGVGWGLLATLADHSPQFFTDYVRDPKSKNPKTQMAASPEYDDATTQALIAYFRTFVPAESR